MKISQFVKSLWGKVEKKIKERREAKRHPASDNHNPPTSLPPYRYRVIEHHTAAHEKQRRAAEQDYWQKQLKLAEDLNRFTSMLNWITGIATVFAGVAALAGFVSVYFLWWTLVETIENNRMEQRAWVGIVEASIFPLQVAVGPPVKFGAVITNSGKTPALKLKSMVGARSRPTTEKFAPTYDLIPGRRPPPAVLFPDVYGGIGTEPVSFTQEQINVIRSGANTLYVFGELEYEDIFGDSHCTTFCLRFASDFSATSVCDTYNTVTDTKCPRIP